MTETGRDELESLAQSVMALHHRAVRERHGADFVVWNFELIDDPRS